MANQEMNDATLQYAPFALDRWKTMNSFQEMMGDDEMAFMLSYAEEKSGIGFAGIYQWDEELGLSKKDSGTSKLTEHKYGSRLGALVIRNHWIPFVVTHGTDFCSVVDYGHYEEIPKPILKQLCLQIFGHPRVIGHWVELHPEPGWCGFAAVSWMLGKFATPVYARSMDEIQPHILQIQEIAGVDLWSKIWNIEQRCPSDRWKWVILLRHEFIISQITSPTVPVLHAGGQEDAAMLKARGKIASVLISKGHQAKESIEIAETISRQLGDSKQVKQFAHQKEESIYHGVIERCQKSGIPISQAAQLAAAEKLQKFSRSKQQAKKSPTINFKLHDVTFPANAFTNPNGDPLMVQENWIIVTRGVAIADPAEVQEVADAGRLVSTECCGALTLTAIKANGLITSELITVQVTDAFQNKALIRVFLTQLGSKKVMKAKWQVRVLKKYQDGRFLVGSDTVKPDQRLAMNGQEILIVEHQDRKPATKPLVAGTLRSTDKGKDPFMTGGGDPWQKMSRSSSTPQSRSFNAWAKYRPSGDVPMDGDGPALSGDPADQIFKNQNERITSIEAKMQTLEARLTEGQNSNLQKFEKIESDISGIEHSLRGSLKEALSQQSEQLLATFESLLKRSPRTKDIKRDRPDRSTSRSPRGVGS
eukprot:symbB.v1.2.005974.t1/scaffold344.1/size224651/16